jgi:GT2 family glycosyltransferase
MTATRLSVILPTFNRADVLARTVAAWAAELVVQQDQLLIVDDGSTDATPQLLENLVLRHPGLLQFWRQSNAGPAAARNRALEVATGRWVLFAGDDVMPESGLVTAHLAAHERWPHTAVLGDIRWHPEMPQTRFIRWLGSAGAQFAFSGLKHGDALPPTMAYTSNLSLSRHLLPSVPVFDEAFRAACWEDVDLGIRLQARGVALRYAADAIALHLHPTDLKRARQRAERIGFYRALLEQKHGIVAPRRTGCREQSKRVCAPVLRAMPIDRLRSLGYRWTLAWPDWQGWQRFQRERPQT